jgi:predicted AlkP superfamily phosphohydrolase/phosphomutase
MTGKQSPHGLILLLALILLGLNCARTPEQKVFVLGVDGLTLDLLVPWAQAGKLPHFAQLLQEGSSTQLVSAVPPSSPPAWTSAVTGVNPGKHGIFGFVKGMKPSVGSPKLIYYTSRDRMADPIWILLNERGKRSVVINVPCSSPPDSIEGVMISGFPHTSPTDFTYPPEYRLKIPDYRIDLYGQLVPVDGEEPFLKEMNEIMDRRADLVFKLLGKERWELFFVVFTITDRVQHFFWKHMDPQHPNWEPNKARLYGDSILKTYQRIDAFLGQLRSRMDTQTTLLVMSDHGFGPVHQLVNGQNFIDQAMPDTDFRIISGDSFGATFYLLPLQKGPGVQAAQKTYDRTKALLKSKLEQLQDPATGQRVIQTVFQKEDLYWGPYLDWAPDILGLESKGYLFWSWLPTEDKAIFPATESPGFDRLFNAYHMLNGALIMAGTNVQKGINNFDAHIFDIAPTVLYLLGEPVPQEMDGNILAAPISEEYLENHALATRWTRPSKRREMKALSDSTEAINKFIEEQLRAIGYVQ